MSKCKVHKVVHVGQAGSCVTMTVVIVIVIVIVIAITASPISPTCGKERQHTTSQYSPSFAKCPPILQSSLYPLCTTLSMLCTLYRSGVCISCVRCVRCVRCALWFCAVRSLTSFSVLCSSGAAVNDGK
jgi:hypothetical protein